MTNVLNRKHLQWSGGDDNLIERRFWKRVVKSKGCWLYPCSPKKKYPQTSLGSRDKFELTHRLAWMISNRAPIPEDLWVLHACDNPKCVRPDHLFVGTPQDNSSDMVSKGRSTKGRSWAARHPELLARGENHRKSVLTSDQVLRIRALREEGFSMYRLAHMFGISDTNVGNIVKRKTWSHL